MPFSPALTPLPPHDLRSLYKCGCGLIADGRLLDLIRRISTIGLSLLKLDIRQARMKQGLDRG